MSPDGTRAAVGIRDGSGNDDVWVSELARGTLTRLTTDEAFDGNPLWSPDGRRVAFTSDRNGRLEVFWQAADGSGSAERLLTIDEPVSGIVPYGWSPDGATLLVQASFVETGIDAGMVSIEGPGTWEPLVQTAAHEPAPTISPDGRWLAYTSNETGRFEIYVQRFPELEDRRQISLGGGFRSSWSADGRELIYLGGPNGIPETVMRVPLDIDEGSPPSLLVGTPERLFDWRYFSTAGARKQHDLSPDGQRFLVIADEDEDEASAGTVQAGINVVLHWAEELKTRVPVP